MHKKAIKTVALIASILLITALATGCGAASLQKHNPAANSTAPVTMVTVTGSVELVIENNRAKLSCKTDVMDGAIFKLSITSVNGKQLASSTVTKGGDNLKADFDLTGIEEKSIYGFATCAPDINGKQPEAVQRAYGAKFELLQSDALLWTQDSNVLVFSSGEKKK